MSNIENLTEPYFKKNPEGASRAGKIGGKKSVEARKKKRKMREQLELLMSLPVKDANRKKNMKKLGIDADNLDNQMAVLVAVFQRALRGDVKACEFIRNTLGENPFNLSIAEANEEEINNANDVLIKIRTQFTDNDN